MLADIAASYYTPERDLNCAEAIVYAANEAYQLKLSQETLRASAGFGGGMAIEETCGALTGAVLVLGIMLVQDRSHESGKMKEIVADLFRRFENQNGSSNCKALKEEFREEDPVKCRTVVIEAAQILEELLMKEGFPPQQASAL